MSRVMMVDILCVVISRVCTGFCMVMVGAVDSSRSSAGEFCDCVLATTTVSRDDSAAGAPEI